MSHVRNDDCVRKNATSQLVKRFEFIIVIKPIVKVFGGSGVHEIGCIVEWKLDRDVHATPTSANRFKLFIVFAAVYFYLLK